MPATSSKCVGEKTSLTRTEYELLRQLAFNANRVMLHTDLLAKVWGPEYRDDVDYLRAYIRYLRRKLEADPAAPKYILTSPGLGYTLACPDQNPGGGCPIKRAHGSASQPHDS